MPFNYVFYYSHQFSRVIKKKIEINKKDAAIIDSEKFLEKDEKITIEIDRKIIEKIILNVLLSEKGHQRQKKCDI